MRNNALASMPIASASSTYVKSASSRIWLRVSSSDDVSGVAVRLLTGQVSIVLFDKSSTIRNACSSGKDRATPMFFAVNRFLDLVKGVLEKTPGKQHQELAREWGIEPPRLSHVLAGKGAFNPVNCWRFAKAAHLSASEVLRTAGKDRAVLAELIEELYGPEKPVVEAVTKELLDKWKDLEEDERLLVMTTINHFVAKRRKEQPEAGKSDAAEEPRKKTTVRPRKVTGFDRPAPRPRPRQGKPPA
jgi:hypothetical protein